MLFPIDEINRDSVHKLRLEEKRGTKKHAFVQISTKVVLKETIRDSSR